MKISVKNLGAIKEAKDIEIKNFNVFIGANGTGKTYFAKLVYFLNNMSYKKKVFNELFEKKLTELYNLKINKVSFSTEEQKKYIKALEIKIKNDFYKLLDTKGSSLFDDFKFNINYSINEDIMINSMYRDKELYIGLFGLSLTTIMFDSLNSYYLPSARANFMITYKHLFETQFNKLREMMFNRMFDESNKKINIFPEIEHRFLESIFKLDTKNRSDFYSIANKIERKLFRDGKLSIRNSQTQDLPSFDYKIKNKNIPIDLTLSSSAISELSPLVMYFRHIATKNDLLVIDEPELSLHPDAQAKLVEILVEAVNIGLKLILVTHSPYILEALNLHLKRDKLDKLQNVKMPNDIKKIKPFKSDRVGAYLFEDETIKDILDKNSGLIDDKLLNSLNNIDSIYEKMRDIEWEARENE